MRKRIDLDRVKTLDDETIETFAIALIAEHYWRGYCATDAHDMAKLAWEIACNLPAGGFDGRVSKYYEKETACSEFK